MILPDYELFILMTEEYNSSNILIHTCDIFIKEWYKK